jgi:lipoyl(octanoyl) transferase
VTTAWPVPSELRRDRAVPIDVVRAGTVAYHEAWALQRQLVAARQDDLGRDVLLLLEHPAVYTLGKRADRAHVRWSPEQRRARGIDLVEVDRGGDVTYHGPGQLVGYPILRLGSVRGVVGYVRALEEVLIRTLASYGVTASRSAGYTGVWVDDAKVAAIGVRVASRGITSHGFALNVTTELGDFAGIVPCGIADREVCSLESLGVETTVEEAADRVQLAVAEVFDATLEDSTLDALLRPLRTKVPS